MLEVTLSASTTVYTLCPKCNEADCVCVCVCVYIYIVLLATNDIKSGLYKLVFNAQLALLTLWSNHFERGDMESFRLPLL